jgi:hypothetical protein
MTSPRYPEAAFLSAMTASATHEVRNVLAIIKESAGLIGDMVHLHSKSGRLDPEKVQRSVARVDAQVKRGADILTALNRLSHSLDFDSRPLDVAEELAQIVFMSERFARKRRQIVALGDTDGEARVQAHPLHFQMALFTALQECLEGSPEGSGILAGVTTTGQEVTVEFRVDSESHPEAMLGPAGNWTEVESLVSKVGGSLRVLDEDRAIELSFGTA